MSHAIPMTPMPPRKKRGLTLIEVTLVLGLIAVVLALVIGAYNIVATQRVENQTRALVQSVVSGVHAVFAGSAQYGTAALTGILINAEKIPEQYVDGANIRPPYADAAADLLTVVGATNTYRIQLVGAPANICLSLLNEYAQNRALIVATRDAAAPTAATACSAANLCPGDANMTPAAIDTECAQTTPLHMVFR